MKTIVFDILNNDNGSLEALHASIEFANKNSDYQLVLFGDKQVVEENKITLPKNIVFNHSPVLLQKTASLREVLRIPSSMLDSINYLIENNANACLSSGDSGSYLAMATLLVKRLEGVSRPAFMPMIPKTTDGYWVLLDVGANLEVKEDYLVQWSKIGSEFYKTMFNKKQAKVGLLNIGSEDYKGPQITKNAHIIIKEQNNNFEYIGFVEPKDVFNKDIDVVVVDGYAGNIMLKTMETSFITFGKLIKQSIMKSTISKIGGLLIKKPMSKIKEKFDYRNVGSAYVIGLDKIVIKAHGASDKKAFLGALNQIKMGIEADVINKMQRALGTEND
ncbi:phosphate acyltransferase PlsX [[Mycoplasma] gypis]|uniref:Phosphate acyltransferase n=1 Tax=[Mycoplasma] gypis TaxID=92404 RepID=A0ABZ2RVK5_9BACT|nr:phosphate acyltransferase PlsX [[Mycoplasma] gypis]MBN0919537.1 phosphate acyltransferase PlsX [[Mycoplasma] gypis]